MPTVHFAASSTTFVNKYAIEAAAFVKGEIFSVRARLIPGQRC
jgi:hypothetical protein